MLPVLMVIDVQNGFITPDSGHVVAPVAQLVGDWVAAGLLVVATRYLNAPGSPFERLLGWTDMQGPPTTDLHAALHPYLSAPGVHVVDKPAYTAFTLAVQDLMKHLGAQEVFLCGVDTDACVLKTALDAFEFGFTPWVITDACASTATSEPAREVHDMAVRLLARLIGPGQMITRADVSASLPPAPHGPSSRGAAGTGSR